MNQKSWHTILSRLSLSLCMLLLLTAQPAPASAGIFPEVGTPPGPHNTAAQATAQPAAIETLDFTAIAAGRLTCALTSGGGVKCWGYNGAGGLGDGTTAQRSTPVDVSGLASGVTAIAVGGFQTCALAAGGGVKCWGWNGSGQLGDGTTDQSSTPVDVFGLDQGVTAIAAGGYHTCALVAGGGVKCWGMNDDGQLGDSTTTDRSTPVDVVGLTSGVTAIVAGDSHTCALLSDGGVKCWGYNDYGQLGNGTTTHSSTPVDVVGLASGVTAIAAGGLHTCAIAPGGGVRCWGNDYFGQLGDGTTTHSSTPVDVVGLDQGVTVIAAGFGHTCALTSGGGAKCWGGNGAGQLGDGTTYQSNTPVDVVGLVSGVTAIAGGGGHTCALAGAGRAKCWGGNGDGALGDGTTTQRSTPVDIVGLGSGVAALAAGYEHTCALVSGGGVKCWGKNTEGQLGNNTAQNSSTPVDVVGLGSGVAAIVAGYVHTCALTSGGGVKCWGWNPYGQLGDGTTNPSSTPVDVVGLASGGTAIAVGGSHTCALTSSGGMKCWGDNSSGQLGDGTTNPSSTPVDVVGLASGGTAIAVGGSHTCALTSSGGVRCWGANGSGQLGDGTTTQRNTPVDVAGLASGVTAIAAGGSHTCALTSSGGMKCWGDNASGQLGDGTTDDRSTPVDVVGLMSTVTTIAAGGGNTCVLVLGGGVKCWGGNGSGQLGDGTMDNRSTPVDVFGLGSGVTAIAASGGHTCALAGDGWAKCWGSDGNGQLGIGTIIQRLTPVDVVEFTPPTLVINYRNGQPGSYFTLAGWNFPPGAQAALSINGQAITTTITVNQTGSFIFFLSTSLAEPGGYAITLSINPSGGLSLDNSLAAPGSYVATTSFFLADDAPLRPQEGGGLTFLVPAGIALHNFMYLPVVTR
jgi:alpha-tubulin suppressor-like RCC1 family protein